MGKKLLHTFHLFFSKRKKRENFQNMRKTISSILYLGCSLIEKTRWPAVPGGYTFYSTAMKSEHAFVSKKLLIPPAQARPAQPSSAQPSPGERQMWLTWLAAGHVVQVTNILRRISSTLHTATILPPLEVTTKLCKYSEKVPNTMCFQQGDGVWKTPSLNTEKTAAKFRGQVRCTRAPSLPPASRRQQQIFGSSTV